MNKFKKLTLAAVSTVMAGSMAFSFAACNNTDGPGDRKPDYVGKDYFGILNDDGSINYDAYKRDSEVTLSLSIGHNSLTTSTSYADLGDKITLPDGNEYSKGDMKPAWVQMGKDLNIKWEDKYTGQQTSKNLTDMISKGTYSSVDMFTTDLSVAVSEAAKQTSILNLADYLDYMPNFRNFLNENPVVYLSLLQDGMDTTDGTDQTIYVAPYFDGNDDIERYNLMRQDWAEKLLNGTTATGGTAKFSEACADSTHATAFMGNTAYEIESLNADGTAKITIKKDYEKALTAAKDENSDLGKAYKAIANAVYNGTSGNIVDIMNAALAANKDATGSQLVDLYRAYIDVCYTKDGAAYFTSANRANLFNGYDACWDADDLVAMLRCVKTNANVLVGAGQSIGGIMPRSGQNDRTPDMVRLACQLYGARGADSRNENLYIAKDGSIKDARATSEIYDACANLNLLKQEGLIADYSGFNAFSGKCGIVGTTEYFMMYDYSQTQTLNGFYAEDATVTGVDVPDGYKFAPVLTPVSKWDVDGDGNHTDVMRFTESWRSTKTGGLALNGDLAKAENKAKLDAALQFVDYLYSEDGQIVSTFGPMAENAEGKGGFWYNKEATQAEISANNYFSYKGTKYSGTNYKGRITPTITDGLYSSFKGKTVNGWALSGDKVGDAKLNFTNYARKIIGATLPVGVKDQSLENQLTSKMGQEGANKVGTALAQGVVKGMSLAIDPNNYWFTCVPTGLPVTESNQTNVLDSTAHKNFMYLTGTQKDNKNFFSIFNWIILNGMSSTYKQQDVEVTYTSVADLLSRTLGGQNTVQQIAAARQNVYNNAWTQAKSYWTYLESVAKAE